MPVELDKIPQKVPPPEPPGRLRWLTLTVLITLVGSLCVWIFWPASIPTRSAWFWFSSIILPLLVAGFCYACRLRYFENERDRILWWNQLHQEQYDKQVLHGQRAAAIVGKAYITPGVCNKLASFLLQGNSLLQSHVSQRLQSVVTCSRLGNEITFTSGQHQLRLERYLQDLILMLTPELDNIHGPLSVRIRHDGVLDNVQLLSAWQRIFPAQYAVGAVNVTSDDDGIMWLDTFLDRKQEEVILSVEINLFFDERDGEAESVSALLLTSPEWLENHPVDVIAWVHRPVSNNDAQISVEHAALWGQISSGDPFAFWRLQLQGNVSGDIIQQMDRSQYLSGLQSDVLIDNVFGKPGAAVGNIALICASENAQACGMAQWLVVQSMTTHQVIVRSDS